MIEDFNGKIFVPSNLKKKKQIVIWKLDNRDIVYVVIIGIICIPLYLLFKNIDKSFALYVAIIPALIIGFVGFRKWNNMKFEEYILYVYSNKVKSKPVRINSSDNIYERLLKNDINNDKTNKTKDQKKTGNIIVDYTNMFFDIIKKYIPKKYLSIFNRGFSSSDKNKKDIKIDKLNNSIRRKNIDKKKTKDEIRKDKMKQKKEKEKVKKENKKFKVYN